MKTYIATYSSNVMGLNFNKRYVVFAETKDAARNILDEQHPLIAKESWNIVEALDHVPNIINITIV